MLAAIRAVKYDPGTEVATEVEKTMLDAGRNKQCFSRFEVLFFFSEQEGATACLDEVHLVLFVWRLWICAVRRVIAQFESAALKQYAVAPIP